MDVERTVAGPVEADIEPRRGSRFRGRVVPVEDEAAAQAALQAVAHAHPDASHHAYAWRLPPDGGRWRAHDGGEPRGSAGAPLLRRLEGSGLVGVLVVVTRWYGGTPLGVGGLARAYGDAAAAALARVEVIERVPSVEVELEHGHAADPAVQALLRRLGATPGAATFGERVRRRVTVAVRDVPTLGSLFRDATRGDGRLRPGPFPPPGRADPPAPAPRR